MGNPLNRFDPTGMLDEDDEKESWLSKALTSINDFVSRMTGSNNPNVETNKNQGNTISMSSSEIEGVKIVAETSEKAKQMTENGLNTVHDGASTTSGVAAIGALSTTGTPVSPFLTGVSSVSGIVAASSSGLNWALTGKACYRNTFIFEISTLGFGAGAKAINAGKNTEILREVYKNSVSGSAYGIGLGF